MFNGKTGPYHTSQQIAAIDNKRAAGIRGHFEKGFSFHFYFSSGRSKGGRKRNPGIGFQPYNAAIRKDFPTDGFHLILHKGHSCFRRRSEEHTSELQSLMRISYAVFCLKKKKKHTNYIQ